MIKTKRQTLMPKFILIAMLFILSSCLTMGRNFPVEAVHKIRMGETTRQEIDQLFGPPWRTGIDDGLKTWTYGHYKYSILGNSKTRDLVVRFNERGIVTSYTFNSTYPEDEMN